MKRVRESVKQLLPPSTVQYMAVTSIVSVAVGLIGVILTQLVSVAFDANLMELFPDSFAHHVQLNYTLSVYAFPILAAFLSMELYSWRQKKQHQKSDIQTYLFVLFFLLTAVILHVVTWWVITPECIGCNSDDTKIGIAFAFAGLIPSGLLLLTGILFGLARKSKITRWCAQFTGFYLALLPSFFVVGGPLLLVLTPLALVLSILG
jgi:membrane protein YdbS with pleckstrin-like domain